MNNENSKSLRNSKQDNNANINNNKMINELKTNINEVKTLYEKDKKDKDNNIKILTEKVINLENKLPKNKSKDDNSNKLTSLNMNLISYSKISQS